MKIKINKKAFTASALTLIIPFILLSRSLAAGTEAANAYKTSEDSIEVIEKCETVLVGGIPFGVRFYTEGVTVVGFSEIETDSENKNPAYNAGLRENDVIMNVNSRSVSNAHDFIAAVENSGGKPLALDCKRCGRIFSASVTPVLSRSDGKYKTGMWIKDSTAGIGTVTYIDPETKAFAGLGHSICDTSNGESLKISGGVVSDVDITGVTPGAAGAPGELKGAFAPEKNGALTVNTEVGIFGFFTSLPKALGECPEMEVSNEKEIAVGPAVIRCTVDKDGVGEYDVNISEIDFDEASNKNYVIEITDPELIGKTGGIVQGMSGSPIIQNGKLIGAVTHVFISDPRKGYGIYIGNMTERMPEKCG